MINSLNSLNKQCLFSGLNNQTAKCNNSLGLKYNQKLASDVFEPSFRSNKTGKTMPKKYIVLDSASLVKDVDVNGDDENDLTHIEVVKRLIKSNEPDAKIVSFKVKTIKSDKMDGTDFLNQLNKILDYVKENKVDGVNISCGSYKKLRNIRENFDKIKDLFHSNVTCELDSGINIQTIKVLEQIIETGTPVFVAAGNYGADSFNILSLAKGVISVGAVDGQNNKMTLSVDHSGVVFEKGSFAITKVKKKGKLKGFDLDNNGTIDVKPYEVSSNGKFVVKQFVGKTLDECLVTDEEFGLLQLFNKIGDKISFDDPKNNKLLLKMCDLIKNRLLTIDQYAQMHNVDPFSTSCFKDKGHYMTYLSQKVFDSDKNGVVVYNPDRSNAKNVVSEFSGTSFASPIKMVRG